MAIRTIEKYSDTMVIRASQIINENEGNKHDTLCRQQGGVIAVVCIALQAKNMKRKKVKEPKIPECKIQEEIMKCLDKAGIYHWRNNVGRKHNLYFGKKGSADITGILKNGIRLEIEVKDRDGKQSDEQIEFERMIKQNNGVYILARSVDDVIIKLFK